MKLHHEQHFFKKYINKAKQNNFPYMYGRPIDVIGLNCFNYNSAENQANNYIYMYTKDINITLSC